jgi:uncharacterized membrane protein required for colicin V production
MVQLSSLMWILAAFFAVTGFLRGWNREIIGLAGILVSMFALFQFDVPIRSIVLTQWLGFSFGQVFVIQAAIFLIVVFFAYTNESFAPEQRDDDKSFQDGLLGTLIGFVNGYLIGGTIWYFLDINEYPLSPYVMSPVANSSAAESLGSIPLVILSGGLGGSGDTLMVGVIIILLISLLLLM